MTSLPRPTFRDSVSSLGAEGRELLDNVFEEAPFGVYVDHPIHGCTYANPCLLEQFGIAWEDFQGFGWATRVLDEDVARMQVAVQEYEHTRVPIRVTYRVRHPGGAIRWVHARVRAGVNAADERVGSIGVTMDVTDQRRFAERLGATQKLEAVGQLAARLAHDLNNLLTVIIGAADNLAALAGPGASDEHMAALEMAFEQAQQLTEQLLVLSRRRIRTRTVCELDAELERMSRLLAGTLGEGIEVQIEQAAEGAFVPLDPSALGQIVLNLASNARDAMDGRGRVHISTRCDDATATITVTDTGTGMDADTLSRAFEPFFTTKDEGRGTGLGLATLQDLTEVVGGSVHIESEVGHGTRVQVSLPRVGDDPTPRGVEAQEKFQTRPSLVLVVEDNEAVRQSVAYSLALAGHTVVTAHSVSDAHAQLQATEKVKGKVEVLVADVMLSDGSGVDFYNAIAPDHLLPVVFMSGFAGRDADLLEHLTGPATFLPKPFHAQDIVQAVARVTRPPASE